MSSTDPPPGEVAAWHLASVLELGCTPEVADESISVSGITHAVAIVTNEEIHAMGQSAGLAPDVNVLYVVWDAIAIALSKSLLNGQVPFRVNWRGSTSTGRRRYLVCERVGFAPVDRARLSIIEVHVGEQQGGGKYQCRWKPARPAVVNRVRDFVQDECEHVDYWAKFKSGVQPDRLTMITYFEKALQLALTTGFDPSRPKPKYASRKKDPGVYRLFNEGFLYRPSNCSEEEEDEIYNRFRALLEQKASKWDAPIGKDTALDGEG